MENPRAEKVAVDPIPPAVQASMTARAISELGGGMVAPEPPS